MRTIWEIRDRILHLDLERSMGGKQQKRWNKTIISLVRFRMNGNQLFTIPSVPAGNYPDENIIILAGCSCNSAGRPHLINDLDLTVTEPGGLTHLPMVLDPSPANVNNNAVEGADHINNIEQVSGE